MNEISTFPGRETAGREPSALTPALPASPPVPSSLTSLPDSDSFLTMHRVSVALGDSIVLKDVELSIAAGEHVVILGPNGCGKSTLIRTMTCEVYPMVRPGMEVRIFGRPRWDLNQLRRHFGVVSDNLPGLEAISRRSPDSAGSNTARTPGADAVIAGFFSASTLWPNLVVTSEMHQRAAEALKRIEASHLALKPIGEMSAGEKRRILIARALVHRPRQLLLDEPSNALDLAAQRNLRESLRRMMRADGGEGAARAGDGGTGVVLVTHLLSDIPPEIDRVILMQSGRIVADGPRTELLTAPRLSDLFQTEVRIGEHEGWLHCW